MSDTPWKDDPRYGGMSEEAARKSWENRRAPEVAGAEIVEGNALGYGAIQRRCRREFAYGTHYIRKFVSAGFGAPVGASHRSAWLRR